MNTDPFETTLKTLLEERKRVANRILHSQHKDETDLSRLPFDINKTDQYIKKNEYDRNKKALKKLTDIV
jgi:hypothetical protein